MLVAFTAAPLSIVKRNGTTVSFDRARILNAIINSANSIGYILNTPPNELTDRVINLIGYKYKGTVPCVENIQDAVEFVLQSAGEYEVAKNYIIYRYEHSKQRDEKVVPQSIRASFDNDNQYFGTELQKFQFYDKYSRWNGDLGRRETWVETVDRAVDFLHELAAPRADLGSDFYQNIRLGILNMQVMPSMRLLAMAGPAARRDNASIYNCFSGDTEFVTDNGPKKLVNCVGESINVLTKDGVFEEAKVRSFGFQSLNRITLKHWNGGKAGNLKHFVYATVNHRWILLDGTEVTELKVGDKLLSNNILMNMPEDTDAIRHGIVFGDGTITRNNGNEYAQIRLCGVKAKLLDEYFIGFNVSYPNSYAGDPVVYCGKENVHWKKIPKKVTPSYVAGFIKGLFLTDGGTTSGGNIRIDTQDAVLTEWLLDNAASAGYKVLAHRVYNKDTNFGKRSAPLNQIMLGTGQSAIFRVEEIVDYGEEEVYCVVEPKTRTFTLANGQITGNCSYLEADSIDSMVELMTISMSGCGVGYSVERRCTDRLPVIYQQREDFIYRHIVEDSSEGWGKALRVGLEHWFVGEDVEFDFSEVRPAGSILKIKGGRASGPQPLEKLLHFVRDRILANQGKKLQPLNVHDIMCAIGNAVVSGGVRRTALISLFDPDDNDMLYCKDGDFEKDNNQRWNANNSAVINHSIVKQQDMFQLFNSMMESGRGEPGIFSRSAAIKTIPMRRNGLHYFGSNPCGEIILRPMQFCNLSAVISRQGDSRFVLEQKAILAAQIGTLQSLATNFPGLRPKWKENCEDERLLGVDITGQMDNIKEWNENTFENLSGIVNAINSDLSRKLGINRSAATTCVKPSGNTSQLVDCSSGINSRWSPYYIRRVRVSATSPVAKTMQDAGMKLMPENDNDPLNPVTLVAMFPVKSPDGAITRNNWSALEQCEHWLLNKLQWTEHNPSITVTYKPDEVIDLVKWIWDHKDVLGGMAFLPKDDHKYIQPPYEEITEKEYNKMAEEMPKIDWARLYIHEAEDQTIAAQELACLAGVCEV